VMVVFGICCANNLVLVEKTGGWKGPFAKERKVEIKERKYS